MASNHAIRSRTSGARDVEYEPDDGNLAASGGSMAACAWIKFRTGIDHKNVWWIQGDNLFYLNLQAYYHDGGWKGLQVYGPGTNVANWANGMTTLTDGAWHFIVAEADYSGGVGNGVIRLWVDGDVQAENTGLTWTAPTAFSSFVIGSNGASAFAEADIDEFCVFEGYSTEAERDALYNSGDGVKPITTDHLANGTLTFRAGFDENSATADTAGGTAAPSGGNPSFTNGFWFGDTTWDTTTLGPDELWHTTHGMRLYAPTIDAGNPNGYEDWSARLGAYAEDVAGAGAFRVTADANGDLEVWCNRFGITFPHQFHIRFQTNGLAADEYVDLLLTAPDSRGAGSLRRWDLRVYSDKIRGLNDYDVAVDTEEWVELAVSAWIESTVSYTVGVHAVVNGRDEVRCNGSLADATGDLYSPALRFAGAGLTGTPYVEVASLAIHSQMPPVTKQTTSDTFPDEGHLLATSNASRQALDLTSDNPWTDKGSVWAAAGGTWSDGGLWFTASILDTVNDRLQIWCGGKHNAWSPWESGQYAYNIGYGSLQLAAWPAISIADGVGAVQGALVYRENTPYLYPHIPGVIDDHDGRRMLTATRYYLPDSAITPGQCMGETVVGELTADETFVISNDGLAVLKPRLAPSYGDVQINSGAIAYNPDASPAWRYTLYGQAYGEPPWGVAGADALLRGMFVAHGETLETLTMWPSNAALLPVWGPIEGVCPALRSGDDMAAVGMSSGGSRWIYVFRGRSPLMFHPAERVTSWKAGEDVQSIELVEDYARGIWHLLYSDQANQAIHYAYMRIDGFDWIGIDAGQTAGNVTTVDVARPALGWTELRVNVDSDGAGEKLEVAVLDTGTGLAKTGFAQTDCDDVKVNLTDQEVTWDGEDLSSLSDATLRFVFYFERSAPGNPTPRLYSYRLAAWPVVATTAQAIQGPRVYVRFAAAGPTGAQVLTEPETIDAVTTHEAGDDTLVETITAWSKVADGHYYVVLDPAEYNPGSEYYVRLLWTGTGPQQTRTVRFSVARAVAATVNVTGPIELTVEPDTVSLVVEE